MNKIGMPKACISCIQFKPTGKTTDHQLKPKYSWEVSRMPFGQCQLTSEKRLGHAKVCRNYQQEPDAELIAIK